MVVVFLIFMTSNRFIRASMRVLKILMKKNKKSKLKLQKRLLKEKVVAGGAEKDSTAANKLEEG